MTDIQPDAPVFSRRIDVEELLKSPGGRFSIEANADERVALAKLNGLEAVKTLVAQLRILPEGKGVHVSGVLKGQITYFCGVTLEPFDASVEAEIDAGFQPVRSERANRRRKQGLEEAARAAIEDIPLDDDPPGPIVNGEVELGEVLAEFFALALDPYPRKPDAEFAPLGDGAEAAQAPKASPFAALQRLKIPKGGA